MFVSVKDSLSKGEGEGEGKVTSRSSKKSPEPIKVLQRNKDGKFILVTLTGEAAANHRASMAAKAERKKGNLELTEGLKGIGIPPQSASKVSPESAKLLSGVPTGRKVSDKPPIVAGKSSDPLSVAGKRINEKPALGRGGKREVPTFRIRETISEGGGGVKESKKTPPKETVLRASPRLALSMFISAKDSLLKGVLTTEDREDLKQKQFALPGKADDKEEKAESGNYPIPDLSHARNALAMVAQHGTPSEQSKVRAAVYKKYPELDKRKEEEEQEKSMFISAKDSLNKGRLKSFGIIKPDSGNLPPPTSKLKPKEPVLTEPRRQANKEVILEQMAELYRMKYPRATATPKGKKIRSNLLKLWETAAKKNPKSAEEVATELGALGSLKEKSMFISAKDSLNKALIGALSSTAGGAKMAAGKAMAGMRMAGGKKKEEVIEIKKPLVITPKPGRVTKEGYRTHREKTSGETAEVTDLPGVTLHAKGDKVISSTYNRGKDGPKEEKVDIHEPQVITPSKRVTSRPPPEEVKKDMDDDDNTLDKSFDPVRAARMNMKPMSTIGAMGNPVVGQVGFHNTTIGANFSKGLNITFEEKKFPILRRPKR